MKEKEFWIYQRGECRYPFAAQIIVYYDKGMTFNDYEFSVLLYADYIPGTKCDSEIWHWSLPTGDDFAYSIARRLAEHGYHCTNDDLAQLEWSWMDIMRGCF